MKTNLINSIMATAAVLFTFAGCNPKEDNGPVEIVFPEAQEVTIEAGTKKTVTFTAQADWTLNSDQTWCEFDDNGVGTPTISGTAGEVNVTLSVKGSGQDLEDMADIDMSMSGENKVIITVIRPGQPRTVTLYAKENSWSSDPFAAVEDKTITVSYDADMGEITSPVFGFTANFQWKVKSAPEGLALSEELLGNANEDPNAEGSGFKSAEISFLQKTLMCNAFTEEIVISDVKDKYSFPFTVKYDGMPEGELLIDGNGLVGWQKQIKFDGEGKVYVSDGMSSAPGEETVYIFNVLANNYAYKTYFLDVTWDEEMMATVTVVKKPEWITLEDDGESTLKMSVEKNTEKTQRSTYFCAFHESFNIAEVDWSEHFSFGMVMGPNCIPVVQGRAVINGDLTAVWGTSETAKIVRFTEHFDGMNPSEISLSYMPDDNSYAMVFPKENLSKELTLTFSGLGKDFKPEFYKFIEFQGGENDALNKITATATTDKLTIDFSKAGNVDSFVLLVFESQEKLDEFDPYMGQGESVAALFFEQKQ